MILGLILFFLALGLYIGVIILEDWKNKHD